MKIPKKRDPASCRGVASFEYVVLTSLVTAAVIAAFVHFELHLPRLFQNATVALQQATAHIGQDKAGGNAGGGSGKLENEAPGIPDQDRIRTAP